MLLLNTLQWLLVTVGIVLFFQGKGSHGVFIAIIFLVPILRYALSSQYRAHCRSFIRARWAEVEKFFTDRGRCRIPYRAVFVFSVLPILLIGLVNGISISSMDNYPTMGIAASLLLEGDTELSEMTKYRDRRDHVCKLNLEIPYWVGCTPKGIYSSYPMGMLAFALPIALLSKMVFGDLENASVQWRLQKWTAAWVAGLCVGIFFIIVLHFVSPQSSLMGVIFLSVGSVLLSTVSQGLWTQGGVIFGFLLAFLLELRFSCAPHRSRIREWSTIFLQGACFALMFASRLSSVGLILPLGVWLLIRSPMRALGVGSAAIILHVPLTFYYWTTYGTPWGPQMQMGQEIGLSSDPISGFLGILFSPGRGFLIYQPWALLLLLFLNPRVRKLGSEIQKEHRINGWIGMFVLGIFFHLMIISSWPCWFGGQCWGSRLLSEMVPLSTLFALFPIEFLRRNQASWLQPALRFLIAISFLMHAPFLFLFAGRWQEDPIRGKSYATETARYWDWTDPPFLYPVLRSRYLLSQ